MTDGPGRRFSREETALILRRATDGERRPGGEPEGGLTLAEIEAAAREAGIDPAAVRRAAAVSAAPRAGLRARLVGAPAAPELTARFEGRLPAAFAEDFRLVVEQALGRRGAVERDGGSLVWHEDHGFGRTTLRATPRDGAVLVHAEVDRRGHLLALVLALATGVALALLPLGGFGGLAALGGPLAAVLAPLALVLAGTRALWPGLQRRALRRLEHAVLAAGALVEPHGEAGAPPPVTPEP